jgi:hypothetical protein
VTELYYNWGLCGKVTTFLFDTNYFYSIIDCWNVQVIYFSLQNKSKVTDSVVVA